MDLQYLLDITIDRIEHHPESPFFGGEFRVNTCLKLSAMLENIIQELESV
jgi:hypothetical protein